MRLSAGARHVHFLRRLLRNFLDKKEPKIKALSYLLLQ